MTWTQQQAKDKLRTLLHDGPTDRLRFQKKVVGTQDGTNKKFKTFEYRRVTNLVTGAGELGAYVNGVKQVVTSDDLEMGIFNLTNAPTNNDTVNATYYAQWFLETELSSFLENAGQWLQSSDQFQNIPDGLHQSALKYAAHDAYQKIGFRFTETATSTYRLEDVPDLQLKDVVKDLLELSKNMYDEAEKLRDEYYTRQGRPQQPLTGISVGRVGRVTPNR